MKRLRGGPHNYKVMDTTGGLGPATGDNTTVTHSEVSLSRLDCATSSNNEMVKLARQASHQP